MNKKRSCIIATVLLGGVAFILLLVAGYAMFIAPGTLAGKKLAASPPTVIVHYPSTGDMTTLDTPISASGTATGTSPIARIELWLDSELYQQQTPESAANTGTSFRATFDVELSAGSHTLVFRAVDSQGLVGQSIPITVAGVPNSAEAEIVEPVAGEQNQDQNNDQGQGGGAGSGAGGGGGAGPDGGGGGEKPNADQPSPLPDNPDMTRVQATRLPTIDFEKLFPVFLKNYPKAPGSLQIGFGDCMVQLLWHDNATDENYFNIWMQREYGPPQNIATTRNNPKNGPTRYDFPAPAYGVYNFWVEAVNGLGGQSSEIKQIWISERCEGGVSTYLEIEALDMLLYGPYDKIHCYLSLEGTPERRIPENASEHIQVQNNWGDITKYWGGEKKVQFPMPEDEELTLSGRCLGWQGNLVTELESFGASVPRAQWDGRRLELKTAQLLVGYRIQPTGPQTTLGTFHYTDYSLPAPQITEVESYAYPVDDQVFYEAPISYVNLRWEWEGDLNKIDNYLILVDGKEFRSIKKDDPFAILFLFSCGWEMSFEVVAVGRGGARSAPSSRRLYQQPSCPIMAEVTFNTVYSDATDDQSCVFPDMTTCLSYKRCDQISIYYELFALGAGHNPEYIKGGTENVSYPYKCGAEYHFTNHLGASTDTIFVPIDPSLPEVRIGTTFWESDVFADDRFGLTGKDIKYPYDQWPLVDEDFTLSADFMDGTADVIVKGHIRGFVFPDQ